MFYRRKILFALLSKFDEGLERTRLHKLTFLLTRLQKEPHYDFVPYRYGCYSYSLKADLEAMVKHDWLLLSEKSYKLNTAKNFYKELTLRDQGIVDETYKRYGEMTAEIITKHTYINYPYHAIKSVIAKDILPIKFYSRIQDAQCNDNSTVLFTLGYEGISLEEYLNRLIKNNIKVLIDVRRNPLSQKYGFSKKLLSGFCRRLGISYIHIPEVGIDSSKRRDLNSQADYDGLFCEYRETILTKNVESQQKIIQLLVKYNRIALTCFEAGHEQCHRSHLAESLSPSPDFPYEIEHL